VTHGVIFTDNLAGAAAVLLNPTKTGEPSGARCDAGGVARGRRGILTGDWQ
jgi:hypothetical protein